MEVGFTGTREGMTFEQLAVIVGLLAELGPKKGHHGDCVGADAQFHQALRHAGVLVRGHPPIKDEYRAFCEFDEQERPKSYYARNRDIVNESDVLIITPKQDTVQPKGGTWYTFGYAKTVGKPFILVWPDGDVWDSEKESRDK